MKYYYDTPNAGWRSVDGPFDSIGEIELHLLKGWPVDGPTPIVTVFLLDTTTMHMFHYGKLQIRDKMAYWFDL